jgi:hypothetical protein
VIQEWTVRRFGDALMGLGAAVGAGVALAFLFRVGVGAFPWLVVVGLYKLTFVASLGLMGAGAFTRRLAIRAEERKALSGKNPP